MPRGYGGVSQVNRRGAETELRGAAVIGPPQLCEPPYTDPYVRWWGRGVAGITGYLLSRLISGACSHEPGHPSRPDRSPPRPLGQPLNRGTDGERSILATTSI
jgi:hypothetical protein